MSSKDYPLYEPGEELVTIVTTKGRATSFLAFIMREHLPYDEVGRELNIFVDDVDHGIRQYRERLERPSTITETQPPFSGSGPAVGGWPGSPERPLSGERGLPTPGKADS